MYFGSMNYAARIYKTSNYHIEIKPVFSCARTTCAREAFSGKVDRNIRLYFNVWIFVTKLVSHEDILWPRNKYMYINTVSANYATDCAQHSSFYLRLDLQLLKTPLCKNLGVKKLLDFAGKRPWLQVRRQQLPALKSYLELCTMTLAHAVLCSLAWRVTFCIHTILQIM